MYIHEIRIAKFRHIENVTIGPFKFNSKSSETFVFAGPNGGGKSSILELIGFALTSSYNFGWNVSRTFKDFSFEVAIGLTPSEIMQVTKDSNEEYKKLLEQQVALIEDSGIAMLDLKRKSFDLQHTSRIELLKKILDYFHDNNVYYRAFQFVDGEYQKNALLYDQIHNLVTTLLTTQLKRPLGFFLKADRSYPQKTFLRDKIFNFSSTLSPDHLKEIAFNASEIQYQDMYDFLVQQRYHYLHKLGSHQNNIDKGLVANVKPQDPLKQYETLLQRLFPDYSFIEKDEDVPSNLFIKLPGGEVISFNDLSSGEKEVFFILSFFIRYNVENAIIMIDEPELHLHPELARKLIRNMQEIRSGNQIWLATHNSEIIDEAGRDRVMYISKNEKTKKAKIIYATDEDASINELKGLFGFSGYMGIAKNLIFLEGNNSSADRKFLSNILPSSANIKFIPANGSANLQGINAAVLSILESNLGLMNFYLIRDRDYLTDEMADKYRSHKSGKIFVLEKHEIENYFLVPEIMSLVLEEIFSVSKTEAEIDSLLFSVAIDISASVLRDMVSFRTNLLLNPEDFSMGKFLNTESVFNSTGVTVREDIHQLLKEKFLKTSESILDKINKSFSQDKLLTIINDCTNEMESALKNGRWIALFPGKELIKGLCRSLGISSVIALQNSLIKELSIKPSLIASDLRAILDVFK